MKLHIRSQYCWSLPSDVRYTHVEDSAPVVGSRRNVGIQRIPYNSYSSVHSESQCLRVCLRVSACVCVCLRILATVDYCMIYTMHEL